MLPFFASLRNRLLLLAALVFLPAFGLVIYGDNVQRELEIHAAQDNAVRLARLVAADQDRLLESPHQLLSSLASVRAIQQNDSAFCNTFLPNLMDQVDSIGSIAVADLNGDVWCSSTPLSSPVNLADRPYFQRAIQTRRLAISDYQIGRISKEPVVNIAIALYAPSGNLNGIVSASIKLAWLNRFASSAQLPVDSILSVTDANHTFVVHYPDPDNWVGKPMTVTALLQAFQTQIEGDVIEATEKDDVPRLYAFAPLAGELKGAGFHATVSIPTSIAYTNIGKTLNGELVSLALVTILAMVAAWLVGDVMIVRRVRALTQTAQELTAGNLNARTGQMYGISELSELARRFDEMAHTIQQRAVENARLYKAEHEEREFAEALRDIAAALNSTLKFDEVLNRIMDNVGRVVPYDVADIMLIENGVARVVCCRGYAERGIEEWILARRFPVSEFANIYRGIINNQPLLISDTRTFFGWVDLPESNWIRSVLEVPIRFEGQVIGFLNLDSALPNFFTPAQSTRLMAFADQAALALRNSRMLSEAEDRATQFTALYETTRDLTMQQDLPKLLDTVVERATKIMKTAHGGLYIYDPTRDDLELVIQKGFLAPIGTRLRMGEGAAGRVAQTRQPMIIDDYQTWENRSPHYEGVPFAAVLQAPIIYRGNMIGVLTVTEIVPSTRKFTEADMRILSLFAGQAASAVHNARLLEETRQRVSQFAALYETMRDLGAQQDLAALLEVIVDRADRLLKPTTVAMLMYDATAHTLELVAVRNSPLPLGTRVKLGDGVAGHVAQMRAPMIVNDYSMQTQRPSALSNVPITAAMGVPMLYRGDLMGVLLLSESNPARKFTEADEHLLSLFAGQVAGAIHSSKLLEETHTRAEQLALLYDAGLALNSVLEPHAQLEYLLKIATRSLHAERSEFFRLDSASQRIHLELSIGYSTQLAEMQAKLTTNLEDEHSLVAAVCRNLLPLYLPDVSTDARWVTVDPEIRSGLWVPVEHENKMLGALALLSKRRDAFTPQDERLAVLFANQAAVALENARLFDETRRRADRLGVLNNIARTASDTMSLDELLEIVYRHISNALASDALSIALLDWTTNELDFRVRIDEGERVPPERHPVGTGLRARVISTQKSLLIRDIQTAVDLPPLNLWGSMKVPRSWLGVPLQLNGIVVGILTIESYTPNVYTEEDEQLLVTIADQVAVTIQKLRLFNETQQRANHLAVLNNVARAVSQTLNLGELLEIVYDQVNHVLKPDAFCIALYDATTQELDYRVQIDEGVRSQPERLSVAVGFNSRVIATRKSLLIGDALEVEAPPPASLWGTMKPARSWLGAPMRLGDTILGIINVQAYTPNRYTVEDEQLLVTIADQVAVAIQNARLFEETTHRLVALEAVNKISTALRAAQNLEEMLPLLLDETLVVIQTTAGAISLYDAEHDELYQVVTRGWFQQTPPRTPASDGIAGLVFRNGAPFVTSDFQMDSATSELARQQIPAAWGGVIVPIRATKDIIGVLAISLPLPRKIEPSQVHLLTTIAEMAGNAIRRAQLHERTEKQLHHLDALHIVDTAISASLDLRTILNILLDQATTQLKVDAADILTLNPHDQTLQFFLGQGLKQETNFKTRLRPGTGYPGRAVLERRTIRVPQLAQATGDPRIEKLASEGWTAYAVAPLVSKGKVRGVLEIFHHAELELDADWLGFLELLAGQAAIAFDNSALFDSLQRSNVELSLAYDATIEGWVRALQSRTVMMQGNTDQLMDLTLRIARTLGVNDADLVHIRRGVLLHDIGQMAIPDNILRKTGTFTSDEWDIVRQHPQNAFDLLQPIEYLRSAIDIPYYHHEKWNGSGYPRGLKGTEIPLAARIFAVVDTWDALRSPRPHRPAWSDDQAREYIQSQAGQAFDPQVVDAFLKLVNRE